MQFGAWAIGGEIKVYKWRVQRGRDLGENDEGTIKYKEGMVGENVLGK